MTRKPKPRTKKPQTVMEWVEQHSKEYSDHAAMIQDCAKHLKVKPEYVRRKISSKRRLSDGWRKKSSSPVKKGKEGISREQFRAQFDKDTGIREGIRAGLLSLGPTEIVACGQFRVERCRNSGTGGWRQVAEEEEFLPYQFRCGSRIWWATKATVKWTLEHVSKAKGM